MKRITVSFAVDINMDDESEIDANYVKELLCECTGSIDYKVPITKKMKMIYALHNALAGDDRSSITVKDITIEHKQKEEIEVKIKELKAGGLRQIFIIKSIREQFDLDLKSAVILVRPFFPS